MNAFEIRDVFGPDFQEIIEVACDQVTIEDEFQFRDGFFERRETLRCRAIEHDADHHQRAPVDLLRHDHRANAADVAVLEQRLGPAVTGRGTDVDQPRQFGIGQPPIALKQPQHLQADAVNLAVHGRIFRIFVKYPKITTCLIQKIFEVVNLLDVLESTFPADNVNFQAIGAADRRILACWRNSNAIHSLSDPRISRDWSASAPIWAARSSSTPSARTAIRDWPSAATSCASSNTLFPMRLAPTPTRC